MADALQQLKRIRQRGLPPAGGEPRPKRKKPAQAIVYKPYLQGPWRKTLYGTHLNIEKDKIRQEERIARRKEIQEAT